MNKVESVNSCGFNFFRLDCWPLSIRCHTGTLYRTERLLHFYTALQRPEIIMDLLCLDTTDQRKDPDPGNLKWRKCIRSQRAMLTVSPAGWEWLVVCVSSHVHGSMQITGMGMQIHDYHFLEFWLGCPGGLIAGISMNEFGLAWNKVWLRVFPVFRTFAVFCSNIACSHCTFLHQTV